MEDVAISASEGGTPPDSETQEGSEQRNRVELRVMPARPERGPALAQGTGEHRRHPLAIEDGSHVVADRSDLKCVPLPQANREALD